MPYETLNLGINLTLPTTGTSNWGTQLKNTTWTKISSHAHTGSGDGNQIGTNGLAANAITSAKLAKNLAFGVATTLVPAGTTQAIDFNNGNIQTLDLTSSTGNVTVSFSNAIAGAEYKIFILQHASTIRDITWPVEVKWPQGEKYGDQVCQGVSNIDRVTLYFDGTNYYGDWQLAWS